MAVHVGKLILLIGIMTVAPAFATKYHEGLAYSTAKTAKAGVWNSHFTTFKAYAQKKGVPFVVLWVNPGCGYCSKLCRNIAASSAFTAWRKSSGYVFSLGIGERSADAAAAKAFARDSSKRYPYCAVYVNPIGTVSPAMKKTFTGRNMTAKKFMSKVKTLLKNYVKITLKAQTGGSVKQIGYHKIGKTVTLKATPSSAYKFAGWYKGSTRVSTKSVYKLKVRSAGTYTAKFKKKK